MALTGDLKTFSLVDILQIIAKDRRSGILIVEWQDIAIAYYVKDGQIIFARPIDKVYRVYADKDFDLLIEKLRISKDNLFRTVHRFLIERLHMREGVFSFTPGFVKYDSTYPVAYPIENIIMIASRTLSPEEVERKISDELIVFEPVEGSEEKLKKVELTTEEKKVFSLVDSERTVYDIRKDSGLDNLTVDRALYGFLALGVIKRKRKEKKQKPSIALDLLMKIIERIIVIAGPFAAGKTQFIETVSEIKPVKTERKTQAVGEKNVKEYTTVAMDFGKIRIDDEHELYLFGTPGQSRFDFMWEILGEGALGIIILVDSTDPSTFHEARKIINFFQSRFPVPMVVGANKQDLPNAWPPEDVASALDISEDEGIPVLPVSAIDKESVKKVLLALLEIIREELSA